MRHFGTTFSETVTALGLHLGRKATSKIDRWNAIARIVVTGVVLAVGIGMTVWGKGSQETLGSTMIGAVMGYWLK